MSIQATPAGSTDPALEHGWGAYRRWAQSARARKRRQQLSRTVVLWLGIGGALLAVLSQVRLPEDQAFFVRVAAVGSALLLGLAALFGRELLSPARERSWVRSRATAEAVKSHCFRYAAQMSPYEGATAATIFLDKIEQLLAAQSGAPDASPAGTTPPAPPYPLSIDQYIQRRVTDQVTFFRNTAARCQQRASRWRWLALLVAAVAIFLGALSGFSTNEALAPWIAVLTTAGAALLAHLANTRYEYLTTTYQATADRLESLVARWRSLNPAPGDRSAGERFVFDCESALETENQAWLAEWSRDAAPAPLASRTPDTNPTRPPRAADVLRSP